MARAPASAPVPWARPLPVFGRRAAVAAAVLGLAAAARPPDAARAQAQGPSQFIEPGVELRAGGADPRIVDLELDEHTVYTIPVALDRVTTINFPSEILGLEAKNVSMDNAAAGRFQLSYQPKSYYFSVTASTPGGRANLNVIWNFKTYSLDLVESKEPFYSVNFTVGSNVRRPLRVTPTRLLGILDKVKAFPLLAPNFPRDFQNVGVIAPNRIIDNNDFLVTLNKVYRFDADDTLVFDLTLTNKTDRELNYQPQGFAVRVGNNVYYQSISDASGRMPPGSSTPAYFAVTGTPTGQRNDLSLKNTFTVIVNQTEDLPQAEQTIQTTIGSERRTTTTTTTTGDYKNVAPAEPPPRRRRGR